MPPHSRLLPMLLCAMLLLAPARAWAWSLLTGTQGAPERACEVLRELPHDPKAFTQGFLYLDGKFYESTGLYGSSDIRVTNAETGEVLDSDPLGGGFFGEGLALTEKGLAQLTWREGKLFFYDRKTLDLKTVAAYPKSWEGSEGWGLASGPGYLLMSDGGPSLHVLDPATMERVSSVLVLDAGQPVRLLNELEVVNDHVLANVWHSDRIAVIRPDTGEVEFWIDLSALRPRLNEDAETANGIAWDAAGQRLFVTGKRWNRVFEIRPPKRLLKPVPAS